MYGVLISALLAILAWATAVSLGSATGGLVAAIVVLFAGVATGGYGLGRHLREPRRREPRRRG